MQLVYPDRIQIVLFSLATIILMSQVTELRHVECKKNVHVIQLQNGGPGAESYLDPRSIFSSLQSSVPHPPQGTLFRRVENSYKN